jgi:membrane protein required for colicin V production
MEEQAVSLFDIGVGLIVLVSAIFAFYRGFVRELLSIAGWVGAAIVAVYGYGYVRPYLEPYLPDDWMIDAASGAVLFLGALIVFSVVIHFVVITVKGSPLNTLDRSLGFLFGVARGVVVIALAYIVAEMVVFKDDPASKPEWLTSAKSLPLIDYAAGLLVAVIPEDAMNLHLEGFSQGQKATSSADAESDSDQAARDMAEPPVAAPADPESGQETTYDAGESEDLDTLIESLDEEVQPADTIDETTPSDAPANQ